jgi:hypothetical protein
MNKRTKEEKEMILKNHEYLIKKYASILKNKKFKKDEEERNFFYLLFLKDKNEASTQKKELFFKGLKEHFDETEKELEDFLIKEFLDCIQEKKEYNQYIGGDFRHRLKVISEERIKKGKIKKEVKVESKEMNVEKEKNVNVESKKEEEIKEQKEEEMQEQIEEKIEDKKEEESLHFFKNSKPSNLKKWIQGVGVSFPFDKITRRERELLIMKHVHKWTDAEVGEKLKIAAFEIKEKVVKLEEKLKKIQENKEN